MVNQIFSDKRGSDKGFTLIEMMVVVAIVAILAAIGIPKFMKYMIDAKMTEPVLIMGQIADQMKAYYDIHGAYPSAMINGNVAKESHIPDQTPYTGISDVLPTLDIYSSANWTYSLQAVSSDSKQFCITATIVNSAHDRGQPIYYIEDISGVIPANAYLLDGHFSKSNFYYTYNSNMIGVNQIIPDAPCPTTWTG